jgi:hypothetical protein
MIAMKSSNHRWWPYFWFDFERDGSKGSGKIRFNSSPVVTISSGKPTSRDNCVCTVKHRYEQPAVDLINWLFYASARGLLKRFLRAEDRNE